MVFVLECQPWLNRGQIRITMDSGVHPTTHYYVLQRGNGWQVNCENQRL